MAAVGVSRRATLRLGLACNNRCVFCAQRGLADTDNATDGDAITRALFSLRAGADEVTFTGGEPTLAPTLLPAVVAARTHGFAAVGIQTNARLLARPGFAAELKRAGLTDVHVSLHAADAAAHDYHTGVPGSFAELLRGVAAARAAGLEVAATTVLTRSNYRVLGALPSLLRSRDVAAWLLEIPRVAGAAALAFDRVVPRLGMALPFALHALDGARRLGLPAFGRGAPLCALGPYAQHALPDEPGAYAAVCDGCEARPVCPGVDVAYLARFAGDELRPRALPDHAGLGPQEQRLARLFVGPGELAPTAPAVPERRHLPLADRVKPARAEVSAAAPRRSGEALRELFPSLFAGKR